MLELAYSDVRLSFQVPARFPIWTGSAFRGGLGQHLRKAVCYHPTRDCDKCESSPECLFYATYQNPSAKRGHAPPPRPIILVPPFFGKEMKFEKEAELNVKLLMLGSYARYFPHVILALQQFGSHGLGEARYFEQNRFEVAEAKCKFSGKVLFDGEKIYPSHMKTVDVKSLEPVNQKYLRISFRTPIELPRGFPPSPQHLLKLIRQRLVLLVNEYGSGERVPQFKCKGKVKTIAKHYHKLVGYSQRSGRREFWNCWTGIAEYGFDEIDETGQWLLGVGRVLGAGAKSSFGLGFFDIEPFDEKPNL